MRASWCHLRHPGGCAFKLQPSPRVRKCGLTICTGGFGEHSPFRRKTGSTDMKTTMAVSAALAAAVALTLFDASPADAAVQRRAVTVRKVPSRVVQPRVHHKPAARITKPSAFVK